MHRCCFVSVIALWWFTASAGARSEAGSDLDALRTLEPLNHGFVDGALRPIELSADGGVRPIGEAAGDGPSAAEWCAFAFDPSTLDAGALEAREPTKAAPRFGAAGSWRWQIIKGGGTGTDSISNAQLGVGVSWFVVDDLSIDVQVNADYFHQSGPAAWGGDVELLFRWHFLARDTWSLYVDGGCGLMWTSHDVPPDSASFNFIPQAGAGVTFDIAANTRLMLGVRWFHVSNANTGSPNPSYDGVFAYVGASFGF